VGEIFMNASIRGRRRPTNMTVMTADQIPAHVRHDVLGFGADSFDGHGADVHSFEHDCDSNCLYCWGPETD
jgi:hypothetical protein